MKKDETANLLHPVAAGNEREFTVAAAPMTADGAVCAALVARSAGGHCEVVFFDSDRLAEFFEPGIQDKLPGLYRLVICGHGVVHTDWDGRLVRPQLMERLRACVLPILWFSAAEWIPEDRATVGNMLGQERLRLSPAASCTAALVRDHFCAKDDAYAGQLVGLVRGATAREPEWAGPWRRIINSLKNDARALREAIEPLIEEQPDPPPQPLLDRAALAEKENRQAAERGCGDLVTVGEFKLVPVVIPPQRHAFWREVADAAIARTGAEFCLCHLAGRPVLILKRSDAVHADVRPWARYLTDLLPVAQAVAQEPDAVSLCVRGLVEDPALKQEAVNILREGVHLLRP